MKWNTQLHAIPNVFVKIEFYVNPLPKKAIGNVKVFDA